MCFGSSHFPPITKDYWQSILLLLTITGILESRIYSRYAREVQDRRRRIYTKVVFGIRIAEPMMVAGGIILRQLRTLTSTVKQTRHDTAYGDYCTALFFTTSKFCDFLTQKICAILIRQISQLHIKSQLLLMVMGNSKNLYVFNLHILLSLPDDVTSAPSLSTFWHHLKTYLFHCCYNTDWYCLYLLWL